MKSRVKKKAIPSVQDGAQAEELKMEQMFELMAQKMELQAKKMEIELIKLRGSEHNLHIQS
jgi:hypothetical protein